MPDEKMHTRCSSPPRTDQSRPGTARCLYLCLNKQKRSVWFQRFVLWHFYPSIPRTKRFARVNGSVADPDPGSGIGCLFDPWIRDPGSEDRGRSEWSPGESADQRS
jgi:hypothetical protein